MDSFKRILQFIRLEKLIHTMFFTKEEIMKIAPFILFKMFGFQDTTKAKLLEKSKPVLVAFFLFFTLENSFKTHC